MRERLSTLIDGARSLDGLEVERLDPLECADVLCDRSTLAVLLSRHERFALRRQSGSTPSRARQLRGLVDLYEDRMSREDCDEEGVEERAATLESHGDGPATLVAFPRFSRAQVLSMALNNAPVPAGITRHIISGGRALRVNLSLDCLSAELTLPQAIQALDGHLASLHPRHYQEPTVLFDS